MRTPADLCRSGRHKLTPRNLIWHVREDKTGGKKQVAECRACANERARQRKLAKERNRELAQAAKKDPQIIHNPGDHQ